MLVKRLFFIILFFIFVLNSDEKYKKVLQKDIFLNKNDIAILTLYEENTKNLYNLPAKIKFYFKNKEFLFKDKNTTFPIFYFPNMKINYEKKELINLKNGVNIFDANKDGKNEIFLYGGSNYGGSGFIGKVFIFENFGDKIIQILPTVVGYDNFEIKYFSKSNIIILAQYIWRAGKEGHFGDNHLYKFYIYRLSSDKKIPIFISRKKFNDLDNKIIEKNLNDILSKYKLYQKSQITKEEKDKLIFLVQSYWNAITKKNIEFLNKHLNFKVFYYKKTYTKNQVIKNKVNFLSKIKNIKFKLNDFLVYKKDNKYIVEYTKTYNINNNRDFGTVRSVMEFKKQREKYLVISERDILILSLKKDFD